MNDPKIEDYDHIIDATNEACREVCREFEKYHTGIDAPRQWEHMKCYEAGKHIYEDGSYFYFVLIRGLNTDHAQLVVAIMDNLKAQGYPKVRITRTL